MEIKLIKIDNESYFVYQSSRKVYKERVADIMYFARGGRRVTMYSRESGEIELYCSLVEIYIGLAHNSGVKASIINGSNTFFVILVSTIIFRQEKLNLKKIIGCVIGFAGVIVVSMNGQKIDMNLSIMGDGSLFLCALSYAFSSCLMKNYSKKDNPVMLSGYQFIFGGIVMIILGLVMGGRITHVSVSAILMLFYLACISAVAYSIWGILLKHNPVSKVAIFGFTNPVFGVLLSAWWLGEGSRELGINALIALVLVCIGICIVNVKGKKAE